MKSLFFVVVAMFAFTAVNAQAEWQCTYSCGSKGQEPKVGRGWSQHEAARDAQRYTCTRYEGGSPKYYQGCEYVDNNGGGGNGGGGGGWNPPYREEFECTYSCGSKGQEQYTGRGWSEYEASRNAQRYTCTRYEGGTPKYFQGCRRL
jgi:hypothetical protein